MGNRLRAHLPIITSFHPSRLSAPLASPDARSPRHLPFRVGNNDEFADKALRHEFALSAVKIREPVDPRQQRLDLALLYVADQSPEGASRALRGAVHLEVLEVERPQVELNDRTTDGADGGVTALRAQHAQEIVEERTGDKVGDDIDRLAAGRRIDLRDQVARPAGDDGLCADGGDGLLLAATDDGIGYGTARPAKLYQTRADAARGAGDEDGMMRTRSPAATRARSSMCSPVR